MGKSEIITTIAGMPDNDPRLQRLAELCAGKEPEAPGSLKLFRPCDAARVSGVSRFTLLRLRQEGKIKAVEIRKGSFRYPESELRKLAEGALNGKE